jgi:hypothetical protein
MGKIMGTLRISPLIELRKCKSVIACRQRSQPRHPWYRLGLQENALPHLGVNKPVLEEDLVHFRAAFP